MGKGRASDIASLARVEQAIHVIRGQKVMLDSDLAEVRGLEAKAVFVQLAVPGKLYFEYASRYNQSARQPPSAGASADGVDIGSESCRCSCTILVAAICRYRSNYKYLCRRIATILLLQPALAANYEAIKNGCFDWSTVTKS